MRTTISRWALLLCVCAGCGATTVGPRRPENAPVIKIDPLRLAQETSRRAESAVGSKAISARLQALFEKLADNAEVKKNGGALLGAVGAAPKPKSLLNKVVVAFVNSPQAIAAITALRRRHPNLSEAQLGATFEKLINRNVDGAPFDRALDTELDRLFAKPAVERVFSGLGKQLTSSTHYRNLLRSYVSRRVSNRQWTKRLIRYNGNFVPDASRATDLLLSRVFTRKRYEEFYARLLALPATEHHIRWAAIRMLKLPSLRRHLTNAAVHLLADSAFRKHCVHTMTLLVSASPTQAQFAASLRRLFDHTVTQNTLVRLINTLMGDPQTRKIGGEAMKRLFNDGTVRAEFMRFLNAW